MHIARVVLAAALATALLGGLPAAARAQSSRDAERRLETIKRELGSVAAERRRLEGERGEAARRLRAADEQVGTSSRRLHETEARLREQQATLATLQKRRAELGSALGARRAELARLLRAAHAQGDDAPLKALLAQDRVADGQRVLAYHRYLQRDRARRIAQLGAELRRIDALEHEIAQRRRDLAALHATQRDELGTLERDRRARAALVAQVDVRYRDRREREQALGRDARALEQLLAKLRAAAARAKAERDAAAARAERRARESARRDGRADTRPPVRTASAPKAPPQVGGLGWPVSGALLAGFGARMPDGRRSDGLLIAAPAGTSVRSIADGTVAYAEWMTGYGLLLIVDHGNGTMSLYAHNDALLRQAGDRVRQGDALATVGSSGGHGRPALYFELRRGGVPVNPGSWLRR